MQGCASRAWAWTQGERLVVCEKRQTGEANNLWTCSGSCRPTKARVHREDIHLSPSRGALSRYYIRRQQLLECTRLGSCRPTNSTVDNEDLHALSPTRSALSNSGAPDRGRSGSDSCSSDQARQPRALGAASQATRGTFQEPLGVGAATFPSSPQDSTAADDDKATTMAKLELEKVLLASGVIATGEGSPGGNSGAASRLPGSRGAAPNIAGDAATFLGSRSHRRRGKRARQSGDDDDVVVLDAEGEVSAAPTPAGAKIAVKHEM